MSAGITMDNNFNNITEWRNARITLNEGGTHNNRQVHKWKPPRTGNFKLNVDTSSFLGAAFFTIGMVLRDSQGTFLVGRNLSLEAPGSVFEAEALGVHEALSWIKDRQMHHAQIELESYSLTVVRGLNEGVENLLEVEDQYKILLHDLRKEHFNPFY